MTGESCSKQTCQNPCKNGDPIDLSKTDLTESDVENVVKLKNVNRSDVDLLIKKKLYNGIRYQMEDYKFE